MFTNDRRSQGGFLRRPVAIAAMVGLAATLAVGIGVSSASAATLTNVSMAVSNNQAGATGVTDTLQLTTATTGVIAQVGFNGQSPTGSLGLGTVFGLGAGTMTQNGTYYTYTVTSPVSIAAGTSIYIEVTGVVNGAAGVAWGTGAYTYAAAGGPATDNGTFAPIPIGSNNTAASLQVAKSLSFTNDTPSYTLLMDPSLAALSDLSKTVNLGVKTNAGQGYTISMKDTGMKTAGTGASLYTIPASGAVTSAAFAANTFGVGATVVGSNSLAALGSTYSTNFAGYTTAGANVITATKPTGNTADSIALNNRVKIDYTTPAGTYTDTITYTAIPAY